MKRFLFTGFSICLALTAPFSLAQTQLEPLSDNAIAHFHQGEYYMSVARYDFAVREFQIAIKLKPRTQMTAAFYNNMGLAYQRLGEAAKAIVCFQEAITLNPVFGVYFNNLAKSYRHAGSLNSAIAQVQDSVRKTPSDIKGWYLLGALLHENGEYPAADQAFEQYIKLAPDTQLAQSARYYMHDRPADISPHPNPYPFDIPAPGVEDTQLP